eukprot:TRINITY_DN7510_c0_g1_i3.p1 TRINITY_DN7510_c0_g1~~TRINITY_DN7510_c0_g1_i3.p1  ORF type:complete len:874 (-),score=157.15 TRINITY_DN7510_c0_g1_i3:118-2739(-)
MMLAAFATLGAFLSSFEIGGASRTKVVRLDKSLKCIIDGPKGMQVTFPVQKCRKECSLMAKEPGSSVDLVTKHFSSLFTPELVDNTCFCFSKGRPYVQFKVVGPMARSCAENSDEAKFECWRTYTKFSAQIIGVDANGIRARHDPNQLAFAQFAVQPECDPCEGDECSQSTLPSLLENIDEAARYTIASGLASTDLSLTGVKDLLAAFPGSDIQALMRLVVSDSQEEMPSETADAVESPRSSSPQDVYEWLAQPPPAFETSFEDIFSPPASDIGDEAEETDPSLSTESLNASLAADLESLKCIIDGPKGMQVTFPVQKCRKECNLMAKLADSSVDVVTKHFSSLFTTELVDKTCVCSAKGREYVRFKAFGFMTQSCEANSVAAKLECWQAYTKFSAQVIKADGSGMRASVDHNQVAIGQFSVQPECDACEGEECSQSNLPSLLENLGAEAQRTIAKAMRSQKLGLAGLKDFIAALPASEVEALEAASPSSEGLESTSVEDDEEPSDFTPTEASEFAAPSEDEHEHESAKQPRGASTVPASHAAVKLPILPSSATHWGAAPIWRRSFAPAEDSAELSEDRVIVETSGDGKQSEETQDESAALAASRASKAEAVKQPRGASTVPASHAAVKLPILPSSATHWGAAPIWRRSFAPAEDSAELSEDRVIVETSGDGKQSEETQDESAALAASRASKAEAVKQPRGASTVPASHAAVKLPILPSSATHWGAAPIWRRSFAPAEDSAELSEDRVIVETSGDGKQSEETQDESAALAASRANKAEAVKQPILPSSMTHPGAAQIRVRRSSADEQQPPSADSTTSAAQDGKASEAKVAGAPDTPPQDAGQKSAAHLKWSSNFMVQLFVFGSFCSCIDFLRY